MQVQELIAALDQEIARLRQARDLIVGTEAPKRRGRPKGSTNKTTSPAAAKSVAKPGRPSSEANGSQPKRQMSPEGKARIAAAQKARWAAQKAASGTARKTRGAGKSKPATTLDRRTRAGRAAAKGTNAKRPGRLSKRALNTKPASSITPAPELTGQS